MAQYTGGPGYEQYHEKRKKMRVTHLINNTESVDVSSLVTVRQATKSRIYILVSTDHPTKFSMNLAVTRGNAVIRKRTMWGQYGKKPL